MKCVITRSTISYVRTFVLSQTMDFIEQFSVHMQNFWSKFNIFVFNNNRAFSSFHRNILSKWVTHKPDTIAIFQDHFENTEHINKISLLLQHWHSLTEFLGISRISTHKNYQKQIDDYDDKVKELYDVGAKTVLTMNVTGDHEMFYYHVLCFYIPKIAQETCNKYGLGIVIYTIQGFERQNKESKNILKRFSNNVGNITIPNLKRIWDIFQHSKDAY